MKACGCTGTETIEESFLPPFDAPNLLSMASPGERDPCGFISVPPSVVVRVVGTGRNDINGLLGIVSSYNLERERYLVHMTKSQSIMAMKKEHLTKAGMFESYRAQWEQLQNDPRVREKMSKYLNLCRHYVFPMKLTHVVSFVIFFFGFLVYYVGPVKTVMTTSLLVLLGVIVGPEIAAGKTKPSALMETFPERSRALFEKQLPFLRGKINNNMAAGAVLVLVLLCAQSLLLPFLTQDVAIEEVIPVSPVAEDPEQRFDLATLERFYSLGYEDAMKGREHGSSIDDNLELLLPEMEMEMEVEEEIEPEFIPQPPVRPKLTKKTILLRLTSLTNIGSMFFLYRSAVDLGTDTSTNLFSVGQLAANIQHHTEWWRKVLLILSLYNVVRIFL